MHPGEQSLRLLSGGLLTPECAPTKSWHHTPASEIFEAGSTRGSFSARRLTRASFLFESWFPLSPVH
jgi:hypothetical protein